MATLGSQTLYKVNGVMVIMSHGFFFVGGGLYHLSDIDDVDICDVTCIPLSFAPLQYTRKYDGLYIYIFIVT